MSRLIFKECCQNIRKTLGDQSKKGLRYSLLSFRHATFLRNKLKDDKYTFLAQIFGYPSTTQLKNYISSIWKDSDGPCNEILERKRCEFENNNKSLDKLDFR